MRGGFRRGRQEEEEESVFISMTDMTVSFLLIIMILLAFFISSYSETDMVPRRELIEMTDKFNNMRDQRDRLNEEVEKLQRQLAALKIELDKERRKNQKIEIDLNNANLRVSYFKNKTQKLNAKIQELNSDILEKNKTIKMQSEKIDALERITENLRKRLAQLDQRDPLEAYLTRAAVARLKVLQELRDKIRIDFPDLLIEISAESDALRFQGEGLFEIGSSVLRERPRRIVETIAERLHEVLPCYTLGGVSDFTTSCNPSAALIEAIQIEGHTDAQGPDLSNLRLSTERANATFSAMLSRRPDLTEHLNYREQPVLSVAGYGEMRPVADNGTVEGRATNRRIDLRIIMYTPVKSTEIETIRARLSGSAGETNQ